MILQVALQKAEHIRQRGWGKLELPFDEWMDLGVELRVFHVAPVASSFLLLGIEVRPRDGTL